MESIKQQLYSGGFNCYGDDDDDKLSTGALVGIIVGSVVAVVLLALIAYYLFKKSKVSESTEPKESSPPQA
eukprot:scaffold109515_cov34-Attheya_sp.AAC.1